MIARQSVWSNDEVAKLAKDFIPCADEVWRLQNSQDADCVHFRKWCDEGGTLNGDGPQTTRQGTFCCTPSGIFLGSLNHRQPARVAQMLRDALKKYNEIKKEDRLLKEDPAKTWETINRAEKQYPTDGLVLRVNSRDMPRQGLRQDDWRTHAWNFEYVWFRKAELDGLVPNSFDKNTKWDIPDTVVRRIARYALIDNVRGQTPAWTAEQVKEDEIKCSVSNIKRGTVYFDMTGKFLMEAEGRKIELTLVGKGEYNTRKQALEKFELVLAGERTGRTQYNAREDDTETAPIAYVLHIAPDHPTEKIAPAEFWSYGWR